MCFFVFCYFSQKNCHNFIRVLLLHEEKVFACGTNAFTPNCTWRDVSSPCSFTQTDTKMPRCFWLSLLRAAWMKGSSEWIEPIKRLHFFSLTSGDNFVALKLYSEHALTGFSICCLINLVFFMCLLTTWILMKRENMESSIWKFEAKSCSLCSTAFSCGRDITKCRCLRSKSCYKWTEQSQIQGVEEHHCLYSHQ